MQGGLAPKWMSNRNDMTAVHPELLYQGSPVYLSGQTYAGGICDPLSVQGYLSPANATAVESVTTLTGQQVDALFIPDATSDKLIFLERFSNGTLTLWSGSSQVNNLTLTSSTRVPGASQSWTGTDLELYQINGVMKIFFAYKDTNISAQSDIGIFDIAMSSGNFTWLSGTATGKFTPGANELRMFVSDNGFMYVIDGSTLHKIDGTTNGGANGTVTPNVLVFPAYYQLIDGMDARGKAWLTVNRIDKAYTGSDLQNAYARYCGVYVWDRQSIQSQMQDFIPIDGVKYVGHIFQFRGQPHVFTISYDNFCQLRQYTGSEFKVVAQAQAKDYPIFKGSIAITDQTVAWQGLNGNFFVYGRADPFQYVDGLYKIGRSANYAHNGGSGCIILNDFNNSSSVPTQEVYRISNGTFIYTWWAHADVSTDGNTTLFPDSTEISTLVKRLPKLGLFNSFTLYYPPVGSTGATTVCTIKVYVNNGTVARATKNLSQTDVARGFCYVPVSINNVNNVRLSFTYNNAVSKALCPRFSHTLLEVSDPKKKQ